MDFKTEYFRIWQSVWNLHKKYYNIQADDEAAWKKLNNECEALDARFKGLPEQKFVQSLLLAVVSELEREARNGETEATTTQP